MSANNYNFSHSERQVKPHRVEKLVAAGDAKAGGETGRASKTPAKTSAKKK